jgi:hypothetical protein
MSDVRGDFQAVPDHMAWFQPGAPIQRTWMYLIAVFLYLKLERRPTTGEIRDFQIYSFGDKQLNQNALLELMPLPSKRAHEDAWLYGTVDIQSLRTRREYLQTYKPRRLRKLNELVRNYKPRLVIFYSLDYLDDWTSIIGRESELLAKQMYAVDVDETLFCVIPHSVAVGMSYDRLYNFVELLKSRYPCFIREV